MVSEMEVVDLILVAVELVVERVEDFPVAVERYVPDAVDTPLVVVTVETVLVTEVVIVNTGLIVKRPILLPEYSVK